MKSKFLKNEEDILFYAWTLTLFLFFSQTRCPTEVVSSRSNTYYCWSLSDDRRLFPALDIKQICPHCHGLFLFKSFEERVVQNSVFQYYFKANQIAGSGNYTKMFHGKCWGEVKIISNAEQNITLYISSVYLFGWPVAHS